MHSLATFVLQWRSVAILANPVRPPQTPPAPRMVTVTDAHFTQLMNAIKESRTAIDVKLVAFKAELQDSQECAATLAAGSCPTGA